MNFMCNCKGKETCEIPILSEDLKNLGSFQYTGPYWNGVEYSTTFSNKLVADKSSFMIFAICEDLQIENPFGGEDITKKHLGWIIVCIDIFVIIALLCFTWLLENG